MKDDTKSQNQILFRQYFTFKNRFRQTMKKGLHQFNVGTIFHILTFFFSRDINIDR